MRKFKYNVGDTVTCDHIITQDHISGEIIGVGTYDRQNIYLVTSLNIPRGHNGSPLKVTLFSGTDLSPTTNCWWYFENQILGTLKSTNTNTAKNNLDYWQDLISAREEL